MACRTLAFLALSAGIVGFCSCHSGNDHATGSSRVRAKAGTPNKTEHPAIQDATAMEIVPLADGCAYVNDFANVWYVCGVQAVRVPLTENVLEIEPDASGGAFGNSYGKGLWYLKGPTAKRVNEDAMTGAIAPPQGLHDSEARARAYWVLLQSARRRLRDSDTSQDSQPDDDYESSQYE